MPQRQAKPPPNLRFVTFNIGAKEDQMFSGPKKEEFEEQLRADLNIRALVLGGFGMSLGRF